MCAFESRAGGDSSVMQQLFELWRVSTDDKKFIVAQAICAIAAPTVQEALDACRREAMQYIAGGARRCDRHHIEGCVCAYKAQIKSEVLQFGKSTDWKRYEITPEVTRDPTISGRKLPRNLVRKLTRQLLKQQLVVTKLTKHIRTRRAL